MTAREMRILAESLENSFMTEEDRHAWINRLRGCAKNLEWAFADGVAERLAERRAAL